MWWHYLVAVPAALFLVNGIPHFTQGLAGKPFPSPFVGGPPRLDSPRNNVIWGAGNLIVGGLLLWLIRDGLGEFWLVLELLVFGTGFAALIATFFGNPERFGRGG